MSRVECRMGGDSAFVIRHSSFFARGFTLIELLVVLGIVGVIVAASVPTFTNYAQQVRFKAATREVVGLLSLARSLAISSRTARTVVIDPDAHEVLIQETLEDGQPRVARLSPAIAITAQTQQHEELTTFMFKPSGALEGLSVSLVLSSGTRTQTIVITASTGAIAVR